jgi:hypothetical protein
VIVGVGVGVTGQLYGKNISHPLLSITLTIILSATSKGDGISNVVVADNDVEPVNE